MIIFCNFVYFQLLTSIFIVQKSSKISEKKFFEILKLFCLDIEAPKASVLSHISRVTINTIFDKIRERISEYCSANSVLETGKIEVDESYFGGKRVKSWCEW